MYVSICQWNSCILYAKCMAMPLFTLQLLGQTEGISGTNNGLLAKLLRDCSCSFHKADGSFAPDDSLSGVGKNWLVLDGPLDSKYLETLSSVQDTWHCLSRPCAPALFAHGRCMPGSTCIKLSEMMFASLLLAVRSSSNTIWQAWFFDWLSHSSGSDLFSLWYPLPLLSSVSFYLFTGLWCIWLSPTYSIKLSGCRSRMPLSVL